MSTEVIGVAEVQLKGTGAPGFNKTIAAAKKVTSGAVQEAQHGTTAYKKFGLAAQQASFGVQDILTVTMNATTWQYGLRAALMASSNNFAQVLAIMGPLTGAIGGLTVSIASALIPALANAVAGGDDLDTKLRSIGQTTEDVTELIDQMSKKQKAALEGAKAAAHGSAKSIEEQRQELLVLMATEQERLKRLQGPEGFAKKSAMQGLAPGKWGETWQNIKGGLRGAGAYLNPLMETPNSDYAKQFQFNFEGLFREIGQQRLAARKNHPGKLSADEVGNLLGLDAPMHPVGIPGYKNAPPDYRLNQKYVDQAIIEMGRRFYNSPKGGPQSVPDSMLYKYAAPSDKLRIAGANQTKEEADALAKTQKEITDVRNLIEQQKAQMEELNRQRLIPFDEDLLKDADPRRYRKMLIEREKLTRRNDLTAAGLPETDRRFGLIDKIAQRQTEEVDRGKLSGVMDVSAVRDAIQNALLRNDDAHRTAMNTAGILSEIQAMAKRGTEQPADAKGNLMILKRLP